MVATEVLAQAAVLLNDPSQETWTNTVLLPCLTKANEEFEQHLEINEIPVQKDKSADITVEIGDTQLDELPVDFVEPIYLYERPLDSSEDWVKVTEVEFISMNPGTSDSIFQWCYRDNLIYINPPNTDREVQLKYVRSLTPLTATGSTVEISQAKNFLAARTAQIAAANLGQNEKKAAELEGDVATSLDRIIRRLLKNKQGVGGKRRRPYKGANTVRLN